MGQSKEGAAKAKETLRQKYGEDYFKNIGAKGGSKGAADGAIKGFAAMPLELRKAYGARGGSISRRGPAKK